MSTRSARLSRLAMWLALALACAWPIAQRVLVHRFGASPWELGGFGMYSVPEIAVEIEITTDDGTILDARALPELEELAERSRAWGTLASVDPLARAIFDAQPRLRRVTITRRWTWLRSDGRLHVQAHRDHCAAPRPS